MKKLIPIELAPTAPVVFVLDRTACMATRDCPEGIARWDYARGAIREAMVELRRQGRRTTLITFGRNVHLFEDATPEQLRLLSLGDVSRCTGQAASEAIYFAAQTNTRPAGGVVVISAGLPEDDTRVGRVMLGSKAIINQLFARTCFLTVGDVPLDVQLFASLWPHHSRLETVMAADKVNYGPSRARDYGVAEPAGKGSFNIK
jgi:hypothetical protein